MYTLEPYQIRARDEILENERYLLLLDAGLGKTLTVLDYLRILKERGELKRVLIVSTKRVSQVVWSEEIAKWNLPFQVGVGSIDNSTPAKRLKALSPNCDIHTINVENLDWLVNKSGIDMDYNILILDELSIFKSHSSRSSKVVRELTKKMDRVVGMTGTLTSNGYGDIWSQINSVTLNNPLGRTISEFRKFYCGMPDNFYNYTVRPDAEDEILDQIDHISVSMQASDYLELPDIKYIDIHYELNSSLKALYKDLKRKRILEIGDAEITATAAAQLSNKLLQICHGFLYYTEHGERDTSNLDFQRSSVLEELLSQISGNSLVFYRYQEDIKQIKYVIPHARMLESEQDIADWNAGKIKALIVHPKSASHGLNLQDGGDNIIWYGVTWSRELYVQANARLHRKGRTKPVMVYHVLANDTVDIAVLQAIQLKQETARYIADYLKDLYQ